MQSLIDYEIISVIGSGSFATCFKIRCKNNNDQIFACKAVNCNGLNESSTSLISEINFLRQLRHPNIVQYYNHVINYETKTIYIIMEYCEGGDLAKLIMKCRKENCQFEETYIWRVLYQLAKAVKACHNSINEFQGIILHRDIKPANVFLDSKGNIKLGDFGLARLIQKTDAYAESFVGSPYYMSPEVIKGDKYNNKSDIWSIGCLIYEMCALRTPFRGNYLEQLSQNISDGIFHRIPDSYSNDLQSMITLLLNVDKRIRPCIEVILRHPILNHYVSKITDEFPKLIPSTISTTNGNSKIKQKLNFNSNTIDLSNTISSNYTTILREEIFGSSKEKTINSENKQPIKEQINFNKIDPDTMTKNIFDEALKNRLQAIRAKESLLNQKELNLKEKEAQLCEREKRLIEFEKSLMMTKVNRAKRSRSTTIRKPQITSLDDTYCSIELNETIKSPTVAKLDLAIMHPLKSFNNKKVTFRSPQKFVKYNIENINPSSTTDKKIDYDKTKTSCVNLKLSTSSKGSNDNIMDDKKKIKSILSSIFGLNTLKQQNKSIDRNQPSSCNSITDDDLEIQSRNLEKMWTTENKKAAFEILAAMNNSTTNGANEIRQNSINSKKQFDRKSQLRKSVATATMEGRHQIFI